MSISQNGLKLNLYISLAFFTVIIFTFGKRTTRKECFFIRLLIIMTFKIHAVWPFFSITYSDIYNSFDISRSWKIYLIHKVIQIGCFIFFIFLLILVHVINDIFQSETPSDTFFLRKEKHLFFDVLTVYICNRGIIWTCIYSHT